MSYKKSAAKGPIGKPILNLSIFLKIHLSKIKKHSLKTKSKSLQKFAQ